MFLEIGVPKVLTTETAIFRNHYFQRTPLTGRGRDMPEMRHRNIFNKKLGLVKKCLLFFHILYLTGSYSIQ